MLRAMRIGSGLPATLFCDQRASRAWTLGIQIQLPSAFTRSARPVGTSRASSVRTARRRAPGSRTQQENHR